MEIVVNLEPWPIDSPVSHDSTRFIVKDEAKNEVTDVTTTSLVFVSEMDIPLGSTYYVVAERHFSLKDNSYDISNLNYQSEEFIITNNESEISNMLLSKDIIIETPYLYFNKEDMNTVGETVEIRSSRYKGVGDGHTHTHWILKANGTIIDKSLSDNVNKISFNINKDKIKNLSSFEVYCVHCSNNIESSIGKIKITLNTLNFELENNIASLVSTGTKFNIKRLDNNIPLGLTKALIKHGEEILKIINVNPLLEDDYNFVLSNRTLEIKRDMVLELYGNDVKGELGKKVYKLDMVDNTYNNDSINPNVVYKKNISSIAFPGKIPVMVSDSFRNFVFVPNNNMLEIYVVSEDGNLSFNQSIQALSLGVVSNDNMYIKYTDDNYLIIDAKLLSDQGDHPRFIIFKHDVYSDVFSLVNILDRNEELVPVGYNNSIEFIGNGDFLYSIYGSNEIVKVNYITGLMTKVKPIPDVNIDAAMLIKLFDNNILVLSNKTHKTYIYNIEEDGYRNAMSIPFAQFINKDLKKVDLANGDKVLITIDDIDTDGSIAWFSAKENTLSLLPTKLKTTSNNYSIYRKNNENFIAVSKDKDYLTYDVDTVLVDKII